MLLKLIPGFLRFIWHVVDWDHPYIRYNGFAYKNKKTNNNDKFDAKELIFSCNHLNKKYIKWTKKILRICR